LADVSQNVFQSAVLLLLINKVVSDLNTQNAD